MAVVKGFWKSTKCWRSKRVRVQKDASHTFQTSHCVSLEDSASLQAVTESLKIIGRQPPLIDKGQIQTQVTRDKLNNSDFQCSILFTVTPLSSTIWKIYENKYKI